MRISLTAFPISAHALAIDQAVAEWEKKLASGALEERPRAPGEEAEEGEEEEDPALDLIAQLRKQEKEHGMVRFAKRLVWSHKIPLTDHFYLLGH